MKLRSRQNISPFQLEALEALESIQLAVTQTKETNTVVLPRPRLAALPPSTKLALPAQSTSHSAVPKWPTDEIWVDGAYKAPKMKTKSAQELQRTVKVLQDTLTILGKENQGIHSIHSFLNIFVIGMSPN
jgi:hypothetical protein